MVLAIRRYLRSSCRQERKRRKPGGDHAWLAALRLLSCGNRGVAMMVLAVDRSTRMTGAGTQGRPSWLRGEEATGLALISPTLIFTLLMLGMPILTVVAYSFWTQNYLEIDHSFTFENYRVALTEPMYRDLLLRSLTISLVVSVVTVVVSYPVAWFISFHGGRHKNL
eukprot:gene16073-21307_t